MDATARDYGLSEQTKSMPHFAPDTDDDEDDAGPPPLVDASWTRPRDVRLLQPLSPSVHEELMEVKVSQQLPHGAASTVAEND